MRFHAIGLKAMEKMEIHKDVFDVSIYEGNEFNAVFNVST
jgi:hypothetical protein